MTRYVESAHFPGRPHVSPPSVRTAIRREDFRQAKIQLGEPEEARLSGWGRRREHEQHNILSLLSTTWNTTPVC